jgi:two-component system, NarL family, sensor kinase
MSAPPQPPREPAEARGIAFLRLALVPVALLSASAEESGRTTGAFPWAMAGLAVYATGSLAAAMLGRGGRRTIAAQALADLAFAALLVYTSGGPRSSLTYIFYVLPIAAALRLSPALTATWSGLAIVAFLAVTVGHPETNLPGDWDLLAAETLSLAWVSGAAVMLSVLAGRRQRALADLAGTRRALVQQALDAEAGERRRLAEQLHDHAIQNVLLARQEVTDLARGVPGAEQRLRSALDETDRQLRREVFEMHPLGLEQAGLTAVLESLASAAAQRGGFSAQVTVDPAVERAGAAELLVSSARELLANAARHAHASHVTVGVEAADGGAIELRVADDGGGIPAGRLESAVMDRHIGLAALIERVRAAGGEIDIASEPGNGTRVAVRIPRSAR